MARDNGLAQVLSHYSVEETVRRLDEDQPISETPALPGLERVGREIERLSRRLAERLPTDRLPSNVERPRPAVMGAGESPKSSGVTE